MAAKKKIEKLKAENEKAKTRARGRFFYFFFWSAKERKMKKPIPKIRVFGQRSIAPSFLNRNSIP